MDTFKEYVRTGVSEMRPYILGEDLTGVSVSDMDNPETDMGMIARNLKNHDDQWYVAKKYFEDNFELQGTSTVEKTLGITCSKTAKGNISDLVVWGDSDMWKLISKASSQREGWMKTTKAMSNGDDTIVQCETQQRNPDGSYTLSMGVTTVYNCKIVDETDNNGVVIGRYLTPNK